MSPVMLMNVYFLIVGLLLGAIGMYFFDPERGQRRRAMLRARVLSRRDRLTAHLVGARAGRSQRLVKALRRHNEQ